MDPDIERLLKAAGLAPSGDNTQPWRFLVEEPTGRVVLQVDEGRDPSPMNAGQRMARIAVGAALENLVREAERTGMKIEVEPSPQNAEAAVRVIRAGDSGRSAGGDADPLLIRRVTNRRPYKARPVSQEVSEQLARQTPEVEGVRTFWIMDRTRISALGSLIGEADAVMFGNGAMRQAFLSKVRFDVPADAQVADGLPLGALELSAGDRIALRVMRRLPDWLLRIAGSARIFAGKARDLVEKASGLCLIVAGDASSHTDVLVGRAMERAWLALTDQGMAVQPMMSLLVLENVRTQGSPQIVNKLGRQRLESLDRRFRELAPEIGSGRAAFLMRFGYASPPSGRTGRLPVSASVAADGARTTVQDPMKSAPMTTSGGQRP